jgi:hypothetical protein
MLVRALNFGGSFDRSTHYAFRFPAKFHPPVARYLVDNFSKAGDWVIDPFCGSGTLLVEGVQAGRRMHGVDLDPIAAFISRIKSTDGIIRVMSAPGGKRDSSLRVGGRNKNRPKGTTLRSQKGPTATTGYQNTPPPDLCIGTDRKSRTVCELGSRSSQVAPDGRRS